VDLFFDNVGGEILDAVLGTIAMRARIVLCGAIAEYNLTERPRGITNTKVMIARRARMEGFIVLDYANRYAQVQGELAALVLSGQLQHREHIVEGLVHAPDALNQLFSGANHGKTLVVVDGSIILD
jgi:NADPH-dependent curcumin reductase CurA